MSVIRKIFVCNDVKHTISIQESSDGDSYLFLVYQVADVLGKEYATRIQELMKDFNEHEKSITMNNSQDGTMEIILITEIGLYKLLGMVRNVSPNALPFQRWVITTLTELRISDSVQDQGDDFTIFDGEQADVVIPVPPPVVKKEKEYKYGQLQHDQKIKQYGQKDVIYTCKLNQLGKQYLIKMGRTCDLAGEVEQIKSDYGGVVIVLDVVECNDMNELEMRIREQTMLSVFYERTTKLNGSRSKTTYMLTSPQYRELLKAFHSIVRSIESKPPVQVADVKDECEMERLRVENNKLQLEQRKYELKAKLVDLKMMEMAAAASKQMPPPPPVMYHQQPVYEQKSVFSVMEDYGDDVSALGQDSVYSAYEQQQQQRNHGLPSKTNKSGVAANKRRLNADLYRRN
jgi:prophage antirepressor-like protein